MKRRCDVGCAAPGCSQPVYSKGACHPHYDRMRLYGQWEAPPRQPRPRLAPEVRFWRLVDASGPCWEWTGATKDGYGAFNVGGHKAVGAHRFCWETLVGLIPEGLQLDHLCRNRRCVNPDHLEPVTNRENTIRGAAPTINAVREARLAAARRAAAVAA